ncbi:hypothetical protein Tco_0861845 [Tanacetum coccineum]
MPRGLVRKHKERDILHSFYTQKKHNKLQTTDCQAGNPCELISDPTIESGYPMIGLDQGPLLAGAGSQSFLVVPSPVPSLDDLYLTVGQALTPATVDIEEFEASELSDTRITLSHSSASSDFTAPLSPDRPLTQTSPTPTPT